MVLGTGFENYSKTIRRETFLTEMDRIIPWAERCALIEQKYPKAGGRPAESAGNDAADLLSAAVVHNLVDRGVENAHPLFVTCALANLYLTGGRMWRLAGA